jgi:ABC-type multidrug transport system fused ATPase/permease subunit
MTVAAPEPTAASNGTDVIARCYTLPRRLLYPEITIFTMVIALAVTAWIPALFSLLNIGMILPSALRASVFLSIMAALLLVLALFVKYELRHVRILLSDEFLVRASIRQLKKLRLLAIESVSLLQLPFNGGIIVVKSGRQNLFLPLHMRHIRDLAARIEEACTTTAIAAKVENTTWRELHRRSSIAEKTVRRHQRAYAPLLQVSVLMVPVAIFTGIFFWDLQMVPLMLWTMITPFVPLLAFTTADLLLRIRGGRPASERTDAAETTVDIDEDNYLTRSGILFFLLYLSAGILLKTFAQ